MNEINNLEAKRNQFKIFVAYAREDVEFLNQVRKHFSPLELSSQAQIWYDGKILPGEEWEQAISDNIRKADLILLLISPDSIASNYFFNKEVKNALEQHDKGTTSVVPFIIRHCNWEITPLKKLQALPKDGIPVSSWEDHDEAYKDAVQQISELITNHNIKKDVIKQKFKKTEIEKQNNLILEAQMQALIHFIFNSLNSIKGLILRTKAKEASTYISKFSSLLRSTMSHLDRQKIKLSEEIETMRLFIELEALRFSSNFNYQIQMDKTIDRSFVKIPPFILQPFLENAIWHGLLPKTSGDLKLNINIIRKENFLFFEIEDNSVGRKRTSTLLIKDNQKSLGIDIAIRRILLLHSKNYVEIIDLIDHHHQNLGTKVVIKLFVPKN